jgi:RNA polymerase sigma-70 factor (ECF subfamily)
VTATIDDERPLVEAAQADPAQFVALYERYVDRVYAFVSRRAPDRATAEDVTSEVFQHALAHLDRFEWRGVPFAAWLFRIATNALADRWRREGGRPTDPLADVPDTGEFEQIERRVLLWQLVRRLPDAQRRVIEMRFTEEKSIRQIAQVLGRSEGAVKQLQLRALENLRKGMDLDG